MTYQKKARQLLQENSDNVDEIVSVLGEASASYYNEAEDCILDAEYDALERRLRELSPFHPFLQEVGSDVRGGKIDLPIPLGSLDQVYEGDTQRWIKANGWENELFVISDKQDGTSALSVYGKNGGFKIAYSRGNGFQGADITRHFKKMACFTKDISTHAMIRQEVIFQNDDFVAVQKLFADRNRKTYANPRNFTAGQMNSEIGDTEFYEHVKVIGTSVIEPKLSKIEQMKFMEDNGLTPTPYIAKKGHELTDEFLADYLEERRKHSPTAIDGLVIDLNNMEIRESLESSSINPPYSRKFKIGAVDNIAYPKVVSVSYEPSKHGYLKPRVHIEPTELNGVTISNVTGHNAKFIKDNGIGPGAVIVLTRSGDVIPYIVSVQKPVEPMMPTGYDMVWSDNEVDLILVGENRDVTVNRLLDSFGTLDIPHLKQGSIEKLVNSGYATIPAIVSLPKEKLQSVVGNSAGEKIYNGLREKLGKVPLETFASASQAFGRGIGQRKIRKLLEHYGHERFLEGTLTVDDIKDVEGFDTITAKVVVEGFPKFLDFISEMDGYFTIHKPEKTSGSLTGISFLFTGYRDKNAQEVIERNGGKMATTVNKNLTYLVTKDKNSSSSKMKKALELGVKIIDPLELKSIIG